MTDYHPTQHIFVKKPSNEELQKGNSFPVIGRYLSNLFKNTIIHGQHTTGNVHRPIGIILIDFLIERLNVLLRSNHKDYQTILDRLNQMKVIASQPKKIMLNINYCHLDSSKNKGIKKWLFTERTVQLEVFESTIKPSDWSFFINLSYPTKITIKSLLDMLPNYQQLILIDALNDGVPALRKHHNDDDSDDDINSINEIDREIDHDTVITVFTSPKDFIPINTNFDIITTDNDYFNGYFNAVREYLLNPHRIYLNIYPKTCPHSNGIRIQLFDTQINLRQIRKFLNNDVMYNEFKEKLPEYQRKQLENGMIKSFPDANLVNSMIHVQIEDSYFWYEDDATYYEILNAV